MERPDTPSVPPSEPEKERALFDAAVDQVAESDGINRVDLTAAYELLYAYDLNLDEDGFIVCADTGEYAVPYTFSKKAFNEHESPADDPFNTYFVPMDEEDNRRVGEAKMKERIHLSDLHALFTDEDGTAHPVIDDTFEIEEFHRSVGMLFKNVMGWSDAFRRAHMKGLEEHVSVTFGTFPSEVMGDDSWSINCFSPDCEFAAHPSEWDGDVNEPECPECECEWSEEIRVCMQCQEWHRDAHYVGESIYAEPACPECNASVEHLEIQTRYDEFGGLE